MHSDNKETIWQLQMKKKQEINSNPNQTHTLLLHVSLYLS